MVLLLESEKLGDLTSAEVLHISAKSAFLELPTATAGITEVVSKTLAQTPPPTHAGGQDDGSYTNSLKLDPRSLNLRGESFRSRSGLSHNSNVDDGRLG